MNLQREKKIKMRQEKNLENLSRRRDAERYLNNKNKNTVRDNGLEERF